MTRKDQSMSQYFRTHQQWSRATFGRTDRRAGLLAHLSREIEETAQAMITGQGLLEEIVDIIIIAVDLALNSGFTPAQLARALWLKQKTNAARCWPEPVDGQPTEHIKAVRDD